VNVDVANEIIQKFSFSFTEFLQCTWRLTAAPLRHYPFSSFHLN
jgi:hypothetical protein